MSFAFLLLALVTSVNPSRLRLVLPERRAAVALGALIALGSGAAVAAVGDAFLDALDITPETFRLASAVVLALEGARALVLARPAREPELGGLGAALVPVAFPLLLTPGVVMLALTAGGDDIVGWAVGALGVAYALVLLSTFIPRSTRADALLAAGGRLLGAAEIAAGIALGGRLAARRLDGQALHGDRVPTRLRGGRRFARRAPSPSPSGCGPRWGSSTRPGCPDSAPRAEVTVTSSSPSLRAPHLLASLPPPREGKAACDQRESEPADERSRGAREGQIAGGQAARRVGDTADPTATAGPNATAGSNATCVVRDRHLDRLIRNDLDNGARRIGDLQVGW